jgi:NADPH2:quinone reductase
MLAATYSETGSSDVLRVSELPTPEPGPGEVRVRLRVAGVNPTDWKARAGGSAAATATATGDFQIPGQDGAGEIDAVGDGVDEARVGERVWVWFAARQRPWGTAAQYTVVPSEQAVPLAESASFELGASLGIPALTAYRCLTADGPIEGRDVLVAGGAGAVGHAAIELARWLGARTVVATVSGEEKAKLAREAGAHAVVNYRDDDAADQIRAAAPDGVARVVELSLAHNLALDLAVTAPDGAIVTYADDGSGDASVPVRALMAPNLVLRFVLVYTVPREALSAAVHAVGAAVADGALTTLPLHRFPLERAGDAHDAVQAGAIGKVVIDLP